MAMIKEGHRALRVHPLRRAQLLRGTPSPLPALAEERHVLKWRICPNDPLRVSHTVAGDTTLDAHNLRSFRPTHMPVRQTVSHPLLRPVHQEVPARGRRRVGRDQGGGDRQVGQSTAAGPRSSGGQAQRGKQNEEIPGERRKSAQVSQLHWTSATTWT